MDAGTPLYDSAAARAIDRAAAAGLREGELMERAGAAAFALLRRRWPEARHVAVLCGPGNNGGDGYVVARLARAAGLEVEVLASALPREASDAARAHARWRAEGGEATDGDAPALLERADVAVDALLGIGLARAPDGAPAALIRALGAARTPVLSLDLPSGLDGDTGDAPGAAVRADATLTFVVDKPGLHTGRGRALCGSVEVDLLGIPAALRAAHQAAAYRLGAEALARWLPRRPRDAHKGRHGHVLAVGGDTGFGGAIRLCAEAALRSGAGLVSVATRAVHVAPLLAARPEAMVRGVEDAAEWDALLARAGVLAIGPGLGREAWGRWLFAAAIASGLPLVLDADALNLLAEAPRPLPQAVLTPHPGEAARLLDCSVAQVEADRWSAARRLAERYDAAVVLKGAGSIAAAPGATPCVIDAGNPGLASGGTGDVLTGVIAALRAQGLEAFDAARCGALLHALAGDAAARDGERGMLASDLFAPLRRLANPA
jgi:hydroxyethylthiazole kinase-like uncharacterized protein yjeF